MTEPIPIKDILHVVGLQATIPINTQGGTNDSFDTLKTDAHIVFCECQTSQLVELHYKSISIGHSCAKAKT